MKNKKKLSLYIHIPFCVKKCHYCDFCSAAGDEGQKAAYTELLCREIDSWGRLVQDDYRVYTIFIGGGTPTCLNAESLKKIGNAVRTAFDCSDLVEFTMEANPGTVTPEHLTVWKQIGVNRVSLGLQSAQNTELQMLGRIHTYEQFLDTYHQVRESGITNINIDIMAAIPGQTMESYQDTLEKVVHLKPEHISSYSLIVEPGTLFDSLEQSGKLERADEETDRKMYQWTKKYLQQEGYCRYEISNYSLRAKKCIHNCVYWTGGEYLGIGVNASSYLAGYRFRVPSSPEEYTNYIERLDKRKEQRENNLKSIIMEMDEPEISDKTSQMEEFMFLGLRMTEGISEKEFYKRFGVSLMDVYGNVIQKYQKIGMLQRIADTGRIALTEQGIDVSNRILSDFILSE